VLPRRSPTPDERAVRLRFAPVETWMARHRAPTVLDVGCRGGELAGYLPVGTRYTGVDLQRGGNDIRADLSFGLPFRSRSFELVAALDVLEHTDRIWGAFDELCRVSRVWLAVSLPNLYGLVQRVEFVLGRRWAKYLLPSEPIEDRHRWLIGLRESRRFVSERAARNGFQISDEVFQRPEFRRASVKFAYRLANLLPGRELTTWTYFALLRRSDSRASSEASRT
jgi:SAM-dependent methyltransferase